jgi:hypothetical protein
MGKINFGMKFHFKIRVYVFSFSSWLVRHTGIVEHILRKERYLCKDSESQVERAGKKSIYWYFSENESLGVRRV